MKKRRGLADRGYSRKARNQALPILERVEDRVLMAAFVVTSVTDSSAATANDGTLRGEILGSNATTSANTLTFNLPPGQPTITLGGPLPVISTQLTIQGPTGTGPGGGTVPLVQINETINSAVGPAFTVNVANSQIRNLIIDNIQGDAIDLLGASDQVAGCYIGVDPTGAILQANLGVGIFIDSASNTIGDPTTNPNVITGNTTAIEVFGGAGKNTIVHNYIGTNAAGTATLTNLASLDNGIDLETANNTIGGIAANGPLGQGNLISGVSNPLLIAGGANKNLVQGNYIGTDVTGLLPLGNFTAGIDINAVNTNTIGGTAAGAANVIGANKLYGVEIQGPSAQFNQIRGNLIGVGVDKTTPLGNTLDGVFINGSSNNVVGGTIIQGTAPAFGNVIDFNGSSVAGSAGVYLNGGVGNGILSNSIYLNGGPGIVLSGANGGVQPPRLISAQSGAAETRISGTYAGNPKTAYRIQFFASQNANPSGSGDGQTFLGDLDILTDSVGNYTFNQVLMKGAPVGSFISATATQNVITLNNSSAFANDVEATQAAVTDLSVTTAVPTTAPLLNQPYIYTLTVTNNGPNDSTGVILSDTIPTNSIYLGSSAGSYGGGVVTDNIGTLASGASVMVTITVNPTKVGTFLNTATVTGDELDTNLGNNTSVTTSTVAADADLGVTLTPSITNAPIGSQVGYVLTVSNNGPSTATGTSVTVQFPSSFSNFIAMPDQGSYVINPDNSITISLGVIPSGSASTTQLTATPTAVGPATTTATVMSPLLDPDTANNVATATINVANAADLGVAISADPNPVLIGGELIYTVVVTNNGPSVATSPLVLDPLPAGLTFDPTNSNAGPGGTISIAGGVVSASIPSLASNATQTILIAVLPTVSGQVTNTVTVGDPEQHHPARDRPRPDQQHRHHCCPGQPGRPLGRGQQPQRPALHRQPRGLPAHGDQQWPGRRPQRDALRPVQRARHDRGDLAGQPVPANTAQRQPRDDRQRIRPSTSRSCHQPDRLRHGGRLGQRLGRRGRPRPQQQHLQLVQRRQPGRRLAVVVTASTPSTLTGPGRDLHRRRDEQRAGHGHQRPVHRTSCRPGRPSWPRLATQGGLILSGGTTLIRQPREPRLRGLGDGLHRGQPRRHRDRHQHRHRHVADGPRSQPQQQFGFGHDLRDQHSPDHPVPAGDPVRRRERPLRQLDGRIGSAGRSGRSSSAIGPATSRPSTASTTWAGPCTIGFLAWSDDFHDQHRGARRPRDQRRQRASSSISREPDRRGVDLRQPRHRARGGPQHRPGHGPPGRHLAHRDPQRQLDRRFPDQLRQADGPDPRRLLAQLSPLPDQRGAVVGPPSRWPPRSITRETTRSPWSRRAPVALEPVLSVRGQRIDRPPSGPTPSGNVLAGSSGPGLELRRLSTARGPSSSTTTRRTTRSRST